YPVSGQRGYSISVARGSQSIAFGNAPTVVVGGNGTISATPTSGLAVSFASLSTAICTVTNATVSGISVGKCTIAADQGGDANYKQCREKYDDAQSNRQSGRFFDIYRVVAQPVERGPVSDIHRDRHCASGDGHRVVPRCRDGASRMLDGRAQRHAGVVCGAFAR